METKSKTPIWFIITTTVLILLMIGISAYLFIDDSALKLPKNDKKEFSQVIESAASKFYSEAENFVNNCNSYFNSNPQITAQENEEFPESAIPQKSIFQSVFKDFNFLLSDFEGVEYFKNHIDDSFEFNKTYALNGINSEFGLVYFKVVNSEDSYKIFAYNSRGGNEYVFVLTILFNSETLTAKKIIYSPFYTSEFTPKLCEIDLETASFTGLEIWFDSNVDKTLVYSNENYLRDNLWAVCRYDFNLNSLDGNFGKGYISHMDPTGKYILTAPSDFINQAIQDFKNEKVTSLSSFKENMSEQERKNAIKIENTVTISE